MVVAEDLPRTVAAADLPTAEVDPPRATEAPATTEAPIALSMTTADATVSRKSTSFPSSFDSNYHNAPG
jgi:hypothetical protein